MLTSDRFEDVVNSLCLSLLASRALACFDTFGYYPWASGYWTAGQRRDPQHCSECLEDFVWRWGNATEPITKSSYSNWAASEPNCIPSRYGPAESCLQYGLGPDFSWYDVNCAATFCPICEMPLQTDVVDYETIMVLWSPNGCHSLSCVGINWYDIWLFKYYPPCYSVTKSLKTCAEILAAEL
jgi:hypothetical protein